MADNGFKNKHDERRNDGRNRTAKRSSRYNETKNARSGYAKRGRAAQRDDSEIVVGFRDGQPVYKNAAAWAVRSTDKRFDSRQANGGGGRPNKYYKPTDAKKNEGSGTHPHYINEQQNGRREAERPYPDRYTPQKSRHERDELQPFAGKYHNFSEKERHGERREVEFKHINEAEETNELPNIILGRNPVKEAIKSGRSIDRILVIKEHDGSLGEILGLARDRNLVIREVERTKLDELCMPFGHNGKTGNHQGIVAEIPGVEYAELEDILEYAQVRNEKPFIILLDGIEDPQNLGSVIRSAECAGAHGIVITKRRSASVTAAVVKTSAGAAEHMRIAKVVNLSAAIDTLRSKGLWIAGADMSGNSMYETDMRGGFALVIGSEGSGLTKLVKEKCDFLVSIPLKGKLDSLNAAVAAAIIMFEKNRQDSVSK